MTRKQERTVEFLRRRILDFHQFEDRYEYKKFEVEEHDHGFVQVYAIVGRKGDEETMASVLCRNYHQIFIGARGGMSAYTHKKNKAGRLVSQKVEGPKAVYAYHN